jgi:HPr Serine kinase C-terminal domain
MMAGEFPAIMRLDRTALEMLMKGYWYDAYGLKFCSELPLPIPESKPGVADVTIRLDQITDTAPASINPKSVLKVTPEETCCHWAPAGIYSVRRGNEIVIQPDEGADEATLAAWVQGAAISLILHQRGYFVLHASCVAINGQAVAFMGEVGWGKSTTATAFHKKGHRLITDDVVAVDLASGSPRVIPAFPLVKLLPETAQHFGQDRTQSLQIAGEAEKRLHVFKEPFDQSPVPLAALYVLGEGDHVYIDPLAPQAAMLHLIQHAFVARVTDFLNKSGTAKAHFNNVTRLCNTASIGFLRRPRSLDLLPKMVEVVEAELSKKKTAAA